MGLGKAGDAAAGAPADVGTAAGAAAGAAGRKSRLRKASFVDKPVYQNAGKRARTTDQDDKEQQEQDILPGAKMLKANPAQEKGAVAAQKASAKLVRNKDAGRNKSTPNRGKRLGTMK